MCMISPDSIAKRGLVLSLSSFVLLLGWVSPADASLSASSAAPNSVTLAWTAPGDDDQSGTASQYDVRYSTTSITEVTWSSAVQVSGEPTPQMAGSTEQFTVMGLQSSTTYYFAIKTADEVPNWSGLSNVLIKSTTAEIDPPVAVADLSAGSPTATSMTLNWSAPGDDGNVGTATEYDIRYSTTPITALTWASATQVTGEPSPQPAGSSESFVVTGLSPNTTFYFALMTADEVPNWSGLSNVASATTLNESTPPSAIANLGAGNPTEHSIALNWTAPGDDGMSGVAAEYDIRYSTATITESNWATASQVSGEPAPQPGGSFESFIVSGLNSNTRYYFAMKSADEVPNWSAISNIASTLTSLDATPPDAPTNLIAALPTLNSLTLIWVAPGDDGSSGTAAQYDIRYDTVSITDANWVTALQVTGEPSPHLAGTPESLTVSGLEEGTTYYFALKCADEVPNWSLLSNVASNSTSLDSTPPAAINDLAAASGTSEGEIDLSWTAPGEDDLMGTAAAYLLRYSQSPITELTWDSAATFLDAPFPLPPGNLQATTISSLVPGEMYYVAIKTVDDAANMSDMSNVASAIAKFEFVLDTETPAQPLSPPPNAVVPTSQPILVAEHAALAEGTIFRFEVATDSNFIGLVANGPADSDTGDIASWKVPVKLSAENTYYWRVGTDFAGYGEVSSFSVEPLAHAYPNPFRLSQAGLTTFTDLPSGDDLLLMSVSGSIVRQWTSITGDDIEWDGTNTSGNAVGSGTYLWYLPDSGSKGKLIIVR